MKELVFCWKCREQFLVPADYFETKEDATMNVKTCPFCKAQNAITWSTHVSFNAHEASTEDIKDYPPEDL